MVYPETCFNTLVGLRSQCSPVSQPLYFLDDVPGIDVDRLANLGSSNAPSGLKLGDRLLEQATRYVLNDVLAIYDGTYKVENTLVTGCSTCTFLRSYGSGTRRGITIKNLTNSSFAMLVIEKVTALVNATGTFTMVIDDGASNVREVPLDFEAGQPLEVTLLGYKTTSQQVRIYLAEPDVPVTKLTCARGSGCGCSGRRSVVSDLVFTGFTDTSETQQAWGFIPCAYVACNPDDLLCFVVKSAPRMVGMAYLFKTASLYFQERVLSERNNRTAGLNVDDAKDQIDKYDKLYQNLLVGKGTRGVKDLVRTTLGQVKDSCVVCSSVLQTGWAGG